MGNWFQVKKEGETGSRITLNSAVMWNLGISFMEMSIWWFGLQKCEVKVISSNEINENEIVMTEDVIHSLMLSLIPTYEIRYEKNEFHIGPIIGIIAGKNIKKLDEKVQGLGRYVREYEKIGGAIIALSNEGIDRDKKLVIGYLYDPFKKKWVKGIYPYPLSIFKKSSLDKELHKHFESVIGKRIFNSSTFDKWEMYNWFKNSSELKPFLPETKIFKRNLDVEQMMEKFDAIYIKPIKGMQGKKVAKIEKKSDRISIQYIEEDSKNDYVFSNLYEAKDFLEQNFGGEKFILQQSLNLRFNDSIIDFRVIIIKDQTGEWKNYGIMGRNGVKGHIVSNRHRGGKVEQAYLTLSKMFADKNKTIEYIKKMERLAIKAAQTIEYCGFHFGKLGIDIGIDIEGHVWLIEINHRNPNDFVASFSGDKNLVNLIRLANMQYAKRLAGFK
jgi:glutathione synthase/RimK-type ligase-like ATP-grasp enzyme